MSDIKEKIKKLQALANDKSNINESTNAKNLLNKLKDIYKVSPMELTSEQLSQLENIFSKKELEYWDTLGIKKINLYSDGATVESTDLGGGLEAALLYHIRKRKAASSAPKLTNTSVVSG